MILTKNEKSLLKYLGLIRAMGRIGLCMGLVIVLTESFKWLRLGAGQQADTLYYSFLGASLSIMGLCYIILELTKLIDKFKSLISDD